MSLENLARDIHDEVRTICEPAFNIGITKTESVPHSADAAITFPNLDQKSQWTKVIETCVLYIDIRRSTELNLVHKPATVAKLYSAFVRAMSRCATHTGGHVRGIIGDRVMVIFDSDDCFVKAVQTAELMNSVAQHVINKYFTRNEVRCGIGIDYGRMLATKTGIRRRGQNQNPYRSLVWLGRPANVASKLTDIANKPAESFTTTKVRVAYNTPSGVFWATEYPWDFVSKLRMRAIGFGADHIDPAFQTCFPVEEAVELRPATPPILMTKAVYDGYRTALPGSEPITRGLLRKIEVSIPEYKGDIYGGDYWHLKFEM